MTMPGGDVGDLLNQLFSEFGSDTMEQIVLEQLQGMSDTAVDDLINNLQSQTKTLFPNYERYAQQFAQAKRGRVKDPYATLGLKFTASKEETIAAYRLKAKENHPDRGGSNEKMADINAAFFEICRRRGWK